MKDGIIAQVEFDEDTHTYTYMGHRLNGITGAIGKRLGKHFPRSLDSVVLRSSYGSQVHKEVERYYNEGTLPDTEGAKYVISVMADEVEEHKGLGICGEQRVSDFEGTASNIDLVLYSAQGVYLYDIKTGDFDRGYCSLQLNAYRVLFEHCYKQHKVLGLFVIATKCRRLFRIMEGYDKEVEALLEANKC